MNNVTNVKEIEENIATTTERVDRCLQNVGTNRHKIRFLKDLQMKSHQKGFIHKQPSEVFYKEKCS